jgi:LmbE family N-acetylglucosaminyl deacetylase
MEEATMNPDWTDIQHPKKVALIVAHPDDETLWAGGTMLSHPNWHFYVVCLSRKHDKERAPRFYEALEALHAEGVMGDLDDGADQRPLKNTEIMRAIVDLLPKNDYDLILTHHLTGEYTRHLRHEEVSKATIQLWRSGKISANELWTFAYKDGHKEYLPVAIENASVCFGLTKEDWLKKYNIITKIYGFKKNSWEAKTTPKAEAYWQLSKSSDVADWMTQIEDVKDGKLIW